MISESMWRRLWSLCRETAGLVVVAGLVLVLLRQHVADRYRVISPSMEPTLHGAADGSGDVLLVDKTGGWRRGELRPFDIVVVRNRLQPHTAHHLVKRFVAAGPASVAFRDGDLFVRPAGAARLQRITKHPLADGDLLRTSFVAGAGADHPRRWLRPAPVWRTTAAGGLLLDAVPAAELAAARRADERTRRGLPGHLGLAEPLDSSFLDARGARTGAGRAWPRDVGLRLEVALRPAAAGLHLVHQEFDSFHVAVLGRDGRGHFARADGSRGPDFALPPWTDDAAHQLGFGRLDGRLLVWFDGRVVGTWAVEPQRGGPRSLRIPEHLDLRQRALLHASVPAAPGAAGRAAARIARLEAWHDVYVPDGGERFELEVDELFLIGDNVHDSADSRDLVGEGFRLDDVVGRAVAVLAPWSRRRWLRGRRP